MEDDNTQQDLKQEKLPSLSQRKAAGERKRRTKYTLKCNQCQRGFYKASLLEAHMKQHEGINPYTCVLCGKSYARANLLEEHLHKRHSSSPSAQETYPCTSCDKVYTAYRSLKYHFKKQHEPGNEKDPSQGPQHICEKCGKSFGRKAHLTRHKWTHTSKDDLKYACEYCHKRFYTKENMLDHQKRLHGLQNPLRCQKCGSISSSWAELKEHLEKHKNPDYVVQ